MATSTIPYTVGKLTQTVPTTTTLAEILRMTLPTGLKLVAGCLSWNNAPPVKVQLYTGVGKPLTAEITRAATNQSELSCFAVTDATEVVLYGQSANASNNRASISFIHL